MILFCLTLFDMYMTKSARYNSYTLSIMGAKINTNLTGALSRAGINVHILEMNNSEDKHLLDFNFTAEQIVFVSGKLR